SSSDGTDPQKGDVPTMESPNDRRSEEKSQITARPPQSTPAAQQASPVRPEDGSVRPELHAGHAASPVASPVAAKPPAHPWRKWVLLAVLVVGLAAAGYFL